MKPVKIQVRTDLSWKVYKHIISQMHWKVGKQFKLQVEDKVSWQVYEQVREIIDEAG